MILENACYIAYIKRDFNHFGLHKKDTLYKVMFTPQDNTLLATKVIELLPYEMCNFNILYPMVLAGKKYNSNDELDPNKLDFNVLKTLLKSRAIKFSLKEDIKKLPEDNIVKMCKIYKSVGLTFKELSDEFGIDFEIVKEKFDLKQGATKKTIKKENIPQIFELIGE